MNYLILGLAAVVAGFVLFIAIFHLVLPKRLVSNRDRHHDDIVGDAKKQTADRKRREAERLVEEQATLAEELESELNERREDLKLTEEDLDGRERTLVLEEARVQKLEESMEGHKEKVKIQQEAYEAKAAELAQVRVEMMTSLEKTAGADAKSLARSLQKNLIESRQIECQKVIRFLDEELSSSSKRLAQRLMARAMARYAPEFYWPKAINFVEIPDRALAEKLMAEGVQVLDDMRAKAGIEVEVLAEQEHLQPIVKLAGGAGVNREAVRLALTELLPKGPQHWAKAGAYYDKHRATIEQQAIALGRSAIKEVQLEGIHPEIQKLVGYLNWRTSYRQNQWYHTVEVSKLAGILAHELGVDPDAAKRVGLLHDIGKALDYNIEGSHAVISGDYADRFGERRIICDTVMSHHNDLLVESPLAYVLRAADTLSGARPGARVNLEEGYQIRLSGIEAAVRSFPGVVSLSIMNGGREVHVEVNHKRVRDSEIEAMSQGIARKIETEVAFPGEIKVLVTRRFEATAVA